MTHILHACLYVCMLLWMNAWNYNCMIPLGVHRTSWFSRNGWMDGWTHMKQNINIYLHIPYSKTTLTNDDQTVTSPPLTPRKKWNTTGKTGQTICFWQKSFKFRSKFQVGPWHLLTLFSLSTHMANPKLIAVISWRFWGSKQPSIFPLLKYSCQYPFDPLKLLLVAVLPKHHGTILDVFRCKFAMYKYN